MTAEDHTSAILRELDSQLGILDGVPAQVSNVNQSGETMSVPLEWTQSLAAGMSLDQYPIDHSPPIDINQTAWNYLREEQQANQLSASFGNEELLDLNNFDWQTELHRGFDLDLSLATPKTGTSTNAVSAFSSTAPQSRPAETIDSAFDFDGIAIGNNSDLSLNYTGPWYQPRMHGQPQSSYALDTLGSSIEDVHGYAPVKTGPTLGSRLGQATLASLDEGNLGPSACYNLRDHPSSPSAESSKGPKSSGRKAYRAEKPKKDPSRSWIRINRSTAGKSTRTGKINAFDPKAVYPPTVHPTGDWTSNTTGTGFEYTEDGEVCQIYFSVEQIMSFLYEHPLHLEGAPSKLNLWIQKAPADSAKRYNTQGSSTCHFQDCPYKPSKGRKGTITGGNMRVVFDEQWEMYHERHDPAHNAMVMHLYCMERFCDFPQICRDFNVRPDNRFIYTEPRSQWAAGIGETTIFKLADEFIRLCREDKLQEKYPHYPFINARRSAGDKHFRMRDTLTRTLYDQKLKETNPSKIKMMADRPFSVNNCLVHRGDMQLYQDGMTAKLEKSQLRKREQLERKSKKFIARLLGESIGGESEASSGESSGEEGEGEDMVMTSLAYPQIRDKRNAPTAVERRRKRPINDVSTANIPQTAIMSANMFDEENLHRANLPPQKRIRMLEPTRDRPKAFKPARPEGRHDDLAYSLYDFDASWFMPSVVKATSQSNATSMASDRNDDLTASLYGF